jgi:hypothetical protein
MGIGALDLIVTAVLHQRGLIVEMNPVMRLFIDRSEWLFALVKAATLVAAWWLMASYARKNRSFVRNACLCGSAAYVSVWLVWFLQARG